MVNAAVSYFRERMMPDYLPRADAGFHQWSRNFQEKVAASYEQLGFTVEQVAELTAAWEAFDDAYRRMHTPSTRTTPAAWEKRSARAALERVVRPMAQWVRARRTVKADELVELGLRRALLTRTRIRPPSSAPWLRVIDFDAWTARVMMVDADNPMRQGKPRGVGSALVFFRVGDDAARPVRVWQTSRTRCEVPLGGPLAVGTRVRLWACWTNPRFVQGPGSAELEVRVGYRRLMR